MIKKTVIFVLLIKAMHCNANQADSLRYSISFNYGVDLSDSYMGTSKNGKKRDRANLFSIETELQKRWLGLSALFNIYRNSTYIPTITSSGHNIYIPEMSDGSFLGAMGHIIPIDNKKIMVKIKLGAIYGSIDKLQCSAYTYQIINDKAILDKAEYTKLNSAGFGFSYGLNILIPIKKNFSFNSYFRMDDFNTSGMTFVNAGLGINYNF